MQTLIIISILIVVHIAATLLPGARYNRLIDYLVLRKLGISNAKAWDVAGMAEVGDRAVGVLIGIIVSIGILYLMSDRANAAVQVTKAKTQQAYTQSLESLIATCLRDDRKGVVKIGDEWFICSAYPIGEFK